VGFIAKIVKNESAFQIIYERLLESYKKKGGTPNDKH
jgi:hypothetical protein